MTTQNTTITNEQARIIGRQIGDKIASELSRIASNALYDVMGYSLQRRISVRLQEIGDQIATGLQEVAKAAKSTNIGDSE